MSEVGLNYFYDGDTQTILNNSLKYTLEGEEDEEVEIIYKFDYVNGLMFIYENHKFNGNEYRLYKGELNISELTKEQTRKIWESGRAGAFVYDNKRLYINIP